MFSRSKFVDISTKAVDSFSERANTHIRLTCTYVSTHNCTDEEMQKKKDLKQYFPE